MNHSGPQFTIYVYNEHIHNLDCISTQAYTHTHTYIYQPLIKNTHI